MVTGSFYFISLVGSLLTMFAVSVDRLLAVWRPLFYKHTVTLTKIRVLLVLLWGYVVALGSFLFFFFGRYASDTQVCWPFISLFIALLCLHSTTFIYFDNA
jgi:hypothetical protein